MSRTTAAKTKSAAKTKAISETPVAEPGLVALAKQRLADAAADPQVRKDAAKIGIGAAIGAALWAAFSS